MQKKQCFLLLFITGLSTLLVTTTLFADTNKIAITSDQILIHDKNHSITKDQAKIILADMTKAQKLRMLANPEKFKDLLIDLIILEKKSEEAKRLKIDQDKVIQWKITKRTKRILADSLITNYKKAVVAPDTIKLLAKEYYDGHPEEFTIKEKIKVAHILISTKPEDKTDNFKSKKLELAEKILKELKDGLSFKIAAQKYSDDKGSANTGGVINFFTRGKMVKPFEEAAFSLKKKGQLSGVIKSRFGYHIIKLLDHTPKSIQPYSKVKERLIALQKRKYINTQANAYSNSFNANKETVISMPLIKKFLSEIQ